MRRMNLSSGLAAVALLCAAPTALAEPAPAAPTVKLTQGACTDGRAQPSLSATGFPANTQLTHYAKVFSPSGLLVSEMRAWGRSTDEAGDLNLPAGALSGFPIPEGGSLTVITFVDEDGDHNPDAGELQATDTLRVVCPASKEECKNFENLGISKKECKDIIKAEKQADG